MLSEKLYRALLLLYPKEHRREYGDLMVQLFLDRMRYDDGGLRGLIVWTQTIPDLAVSAFDEHKKGENMKKRMLIAVISIVSLLTVAAGVGVVMSQSEEKAEMKFAVWEVSNGHSGKGVDGLAGKGVNGLSDALRQAVEEEVIAQGLGDEIVVSFVKFPSGTTLPYSGTFSVSVEGESGLADALKQAVAEGVITQETADRILEHSSTIISP